MAMALHFTLFSKALTPLQMEIDPTPPPPAEDGVLQRRRWGQDILASENRLMGRSDGMRSDMHQIAESCNVVLREGLGEVQAKYPCGFCGPCGQL